MADPTSIPQSGSAAAANGVIRGCPRRVAYVPVTRGVHRRRLDATDSEDEWRANLAGWQLLLTGHGCFTGLTAARLRGWDLPPVPAGTPVLVAMQQDDPRPLRAGIRTSRHPQPVSFERRDGLRCASAAETLLACARWVSLLDMVVLVDSALRADDVIVAEIRAVCRPRRRGRRALLTALDWVDGRAESCWETLLRVLHVVIGVEVEPQVEVRDRSGELVARVDLHLVGTTSDHEFDGGHHRDPDQHRDDLRRERRLLAEGRVRRGYTASDVVRRPVGVLRDADHAVGREHDPARIRPWMALLRESLYTPQGRSAFAARLGSPSANGGA